MNTQNQQNSPPEKEQCTREKPKPCRFVIGVRIRGSEKSELYDPGDKNLRVGTRVIVENKTGEKLGVIASNKIANLGKEKQKTYRKILRAAQQHDIDTLEKKEASEFKAKQFCLQQIRALNLPMNLSRVTQMEDSGKTTFFFTAEGRVDFRELVKALAHNFKTRIEMRQVGVRDEARVITGFGVCGQQLCCSTFLDEFTPVTIRMAKDQGLALNPSKISGVCGRLMCCLQYEHGVYRELIKGMPKYGSRIETPSGPGKIIKVNILEGTIVAQLEDESIMTFPRDEIRVQSSPSSKEKDTDIPEKAAEEKLPPG